MGKIGQSCIYFLSINIGLAACLRRNEFVPLHDSTRTEPGFNLNEEDMTKFHIWPTGNIPYYIDDFSFDKVLRDRIRMFLDGVNKLTALRFTEIPKPPKDDKTRWVLFLNRKGLLGCADHPFASFTNEGIQKVVLGYHCMRSDENLADIVLSLAGVPPQHNSPDRDENVQILKENILPDKKYLFKKLKDTEWLFHNLTYDTESSGHYGPYTHTSNGKVTIQSKGSDKNLFSLHGLAPPKLRENGFSLQDLLKIAMLYNYISKNQGTTIPECGKLFVSPPGGKPVSFEKDKKIKFREKPVEYLGESKKLQISKKDEYDDNEKNSKSEIENDENSNSMYGDGQDINNDEDNISGNESNENFLSNSTSDNSIQYENERDDNKYDKKETDSNDNENDEIDQNLSVSNEESDVDDNENLNYDYNDDNESGGIENKDENQETADKENEKSYENNDAIKNTTDSIGLVKTTVIQDRKVLLHKAESSKKQTLLGQSDYETGDEGKNKYIHEKNL